MKKKMFTIEYLTSDMPNPVRSPLIMASSYFNPPLHPVENQLYPRFSMQNEHVVPNICSPPVPVSSFC